MDLRRRESTRPKNGIQHHQQRMISQAKRQRGGKKGLITKLIREIEGLISQNGSRTKVSYLRNTLGESFKEAIAKHESLMLLI